MMRAVNLITLKETAAALENAGDSSALVTAYTDAYDAVLNGQSVSGFSRQLMYAGTKQPKTYLRETLGAAQQLFTWAAHATVVCVASIEANACGDPDEDLLLELFHSIDSDIDGVSDKKLGTDEFQSRVRIKGADHVDKTARLQDGVTELHADCVTAHMMAAMKGMEYVRLECHKVAPTMTRAHPSRSAQSLKAVRGSK